MFSVVVFSLLEFSLIGISWRVRTVSCETRASFVAGVQDLKTCLRGDGKTIHLGKFSESFQAKVKDLSSGSFAVVMEGFEEKLASEKLVATM